MAPSRLIRLKLDRRACDILSRPASAPNSDPAGCYSRTPASLRKARLAFAYGFVFLDGCETGSEASHFPGAFGIMAQEVSAVEFARLKQLHRQPSTRRTVCRTIRKKRPEPSAPSSERVAGFSATARQRITFSLRIEVGVIADLICVHGVHRASNGLGLFTTDPACCLRSAFHISPQS